MKKVNGFGFVAFFYMVLGILSMVSLWGIAVAFTGEAALSPILVGLMWLVPIIWIGMLLYEIKNQ